MGNNKFVIFDKGEVGKVERTPEGFLKVPAVVTKTGVFKYKKPDGSVFRQLRLPEEVFNADSLKTLSNKPVTLEHPIDMVDSKNARQVTRGIVLGDAQKEGALVKSELLLMDEEAIKSVEQGATKETSCGYWCDLDFTPGVFQGEAYDAIQRNIVYNHVALTKKGRAGPDVRVQLDSEESKVFIQDVEAELPLENQGGNTKMEMMKVMLNGKEFELPKDVAEAMNAHCAAMEDGYKKQMEEAGKVKDEAAKAEADKMKAEGDKVQAMADSLQSEVEELKKKITEHKDSVSADKVDALVKERVRVLTVASKCLDAKDIEGKSEKDLKIAVIKQENKDAVVEGKSDEYINARFDILAERLQKNADAFKSVGARLNDGADITDSAEKARLKYIEESKEAFKQPIGFSLKK